MTLVLITGATGHVGSAVLLHALQAGYNVRAAVRSPAKAAAILARPQIQQLNPGARLQFVVVPDITAVDAFDAAAAGATHVIHIASPLATGSGVAPSQHDEYFIRPAVRGTLAMLEAAHRAGTVRRVVITSSIVALVPVGEMEGTAPVRQRPVQPTDRVDFVPGPYESEFAAYAASKVAALAQAEAWVAANAPAFDVVHLHPSFVLGRNDGASTAAEAMRGTNALVLAMLLGKRFGPYAGATVHVDDVARAHVAALDWIVAGGQSYILSQPARWNAAKDIVRREFPAAVEKRLLVVSRGSVGTVELPIDASASEDTFGFSHIGFADQVKSLVGQFLEIRTRTRAKKAATTKRRSLRGGPMQVSANA